MPDRRQFLQHGLVAAGLGLTAGLSLRLSGTPPPPPPGGASNPFLQLPPNPQSTLVNGIPFAPWFTGDDFPDPNSIPFHVAWNGSPPAPTEEVEVAIVGGGLSGLASAFLLKQHHPVLFDLRPRFGGNALGEKWLGQHASLGSAYFITPDPGTFLNRFYRRLGLHLVKEEALPPDPVVINGAIQGNFWSGQGLSPTEQFAFQRYAAVVTHMAHNAYPEIPLSTSPGAAHAVRTLDLVDFRSNVEAQMGVPLTPLLAAAVQGYFYSSFGVGMEDISAAAGWNFVAAEEFGRWVLPGGNAWMAHRLWQKLRAVELARPPSAPPLLRAGARVVDVRRAGPKVLVTWIDDNQQTRSLLADEVIMACGKHICRHVLHNLASLDPDKHAAMQRVETMAYVVANVLLDVPPPLSSYDVFLVENQAFPMTAQAFEAAPRPVDVLNGSFAEQGFPQKSVLTLYWPLPWFTARFSLLINDPWQNYASTLVPYLNSVLGMLNVAPSAVRQVRLSRWGHAMPVARPNFIADGVPHELLRPFQDHIWFVNQDNWALPAVENSLLDAESVTAQVRENL